MEEETSPNLVYYVRVRIPPPVVINKSLFHIIIKIIQRKGDQTKMKDLCKQSTISQKEIVDTLRSLEYGYSGYSIKEDRLEGAYLFASELTGLSVDSLAEYVANA